MQSVNAIADKVLSVARRIEPAAERIEGLTRLTGGASQETLSFSLIAEGGRQPLILRRIPPGGPELANTAGAAAEAALMQLAAAAGIPAPRVRHVLAPEDGLGEGFVTDHVAGETVARRILRDAEFAQVRPRLAYECGYVLAKIHTLELTSLPQLRRQTAVERLDAMYTTYREVGRISPVFELAFKWLRQRAPEHVGEMTLVHGDFRNGNLIVSPDGIAAVIDWELAHVGDPVEDLGYLTVNSWRFGEIDKPVGGFGAIEDLLQGYRDGGGGEVALEQIEYWRALGSLNWGVICGVMSTPTAPGVPLTPERAMIGRRVSETEIDLLDIIAPAGGA